MIKYKRDIIKMLSDKGITTYLIRKHKIFNETQLMQLRHNHLVTQETLDKICTLLECQPGYLLEHEQSEEMKIFRHNVLNSIKK